MKRMPVNARKRQPASRRPAIRPILSHPSYPPPIKAIALDVDGVLTDGTFWWGANGEEYRRFSFRDIMGVSRGRRVGLVFALISGEDNPQITRFAAKLHITDVFKNCKDKAAALSAFAKAHRLALSEIAFMGDDVNDRSALETAGFAVVPADAHESAKRLASFVTHHKAGHGAVRELVDVIIAVREGP